MKMMEDLPVDRNTALVAAAGTAAKKLKDQRKVAAGKALAGKNRLARKALAR